MDILIIKRICVSVLVGALSGVVPAYGQAPVAQTTIHVPSNDAVVSRLIEEGTKRSHADADLQYLLDVIGPRLTGSTGMRRANDWTQQKFTEYGMDSMFAVCLCGDIEEHFELPVEPTLAWDHPTVEMMSAFIDRELSAGR